MAFSLLLLSSIPTLAADINVSLSSPLTYGDPVLLQVELVNPERGVGQPQLAAVDGLEIRGPVGPSTQVSFINGIQRRTYIYRYQLTPLRGRTGSFTIGPVRLSRPGGTSLVSEAVKLGVYRRPPPGLELTCEVTPREGNVIDRFQVVYTLHYPWQPRERRDISLFDRGGPTLRSLELPLLRQRGLRVRAVKALPRERAKALKLEGKDVWFQESFSVRDDGSGYQTMLFAFAVEPLRLGEIDLGGAKASMRLRTGRVLTRRDFVFGSRQVAEEKDFVAETEPLSYTVRPLPEKGRPPGFAGAIGRYSITVRTDDTDVAAFDPIGLEIRVKGEGLLEDVQLPAWAGVAALNRDFEVSPDPDSGKVEGKVKVFQQVIRARHEKVTQVPPVPFPYYDPWLKKYVVARSERIAIRVRATKTVGAKDAVVKRPNALGRAAVSAAPEAILEQSGVQANFTAPGRRGTFATPKELLVSPGFLTILCLPPALFGLLACALRLLRRDPRTIERRGALNRVRATLEETPDNQEAVSGAYQDYFRLRFDLPPGEITPVQLARELERGGVPAETARQAGEHLEKLLAGRFGGGDASSEELAARAVRVLREVERCASR